MTEFSDDVELPVPVPHMTPSRPTNRITGSGRYVLGERIGKGGFGVVYLGLDLASGEHVAVKEMAAEGCDKATLESEFNMMVRLRHTHVVSVRSFELQDDKAYLCMEWMPGGSIAGMLSSFKYRLHEGLIRRYTRHATLGLAYLHKEGVVHRDIKPANMLVSMDGTLKLSDFGTCKTIMEKNHQNCRNTMLHVPRNHPRGV